MPASEQADCPLWGIPFAVKDNIDVEGFPTTAACREFGQQPAATSAPTVQALTDAGQRSIDSLYTRKSAIEVLTKPIACPSQVYGLASITVLGCSRSSL